MRRSRGSTAPSYPRSAVPNRRLRLVDRARRGDGVELVRVVEDGRLGRPRGARVVVRGDGVEELGADVRLERGGALLDQPQAEVNVPEEPPFGRRGEERPASELLGPPDVVEERRRQEE